MKEIYTKEFRSKYKCECGMLIEGFDQIQFIDKTDDVYTLIPYINGDLREFLAKDEKTKKVYRIKCCAKCKSILPAKVGVVPTFKFAFLGMRGSGKSVYSLALEQIMEVINQSDFAQREKFHLRNIASDTERNNQRAKMMENFERGILPEPTAFLEREFHIPFEIHNGCTKTDAILLLYDLAGEISNNTLKTTSNVADADVLFYMIDGSKLQDKQVLIHNQECFRNIVCSLKKRIPIYLIVTKVDMLEGYCEEGIIVKTADKELKIDNSLQRHGGTYIMSHDKGYNEKASRLNSLYAEHLLANTSINLYEDLGSMMPKELIHTFAVSSYSTRGGYFSVELPLMHFLAQKSLIPYQEV